MAQSNIAHSRNSFTYLTKSLPIGSWILDSSASDHISVSPSLFSTLVSPSTPSKVTLANGSQTQVKGISNVYLLPSIPLTNVLFTPDCPYNLISISKLTKDLHCSVIFTTESVVVQDRSTGKMIGAGYESQGLYYFSTSNSPIAFVSSTFDELIHSRWGHPSLNKLQKLVPSLSSLPSLECESCQLEKQTRASFPKQINNRASSMFDIVHSDIWSPNRVSTTLGFQYFVTFINDYSRCT
ncbi:hypothetical protein MANES_02G216010v8 [Manihot esculenta]|uniref:Uncharacterized protein n=1 Tax=Manihot esculenta TaxID=3983 RepID=A0ACB7I9V2_MANES|nr:hypothetical protein MANES_02G216010v8 [Manihot esculenta]